MCVQMFLSQVALEADMPGFEVSSAAELAHLKARHGKLLEVCGLTLVMFAASASV
jgi:hypothetical protein